LKKYRRNDILHTQGALPINDYPSKLSKDYRSVFSGLGAVFFVFIDLKITIEHLVIMWYIINTKRVPQVDGCLLSAKITANVCEAGGYFYA
jgi:hypothetical protein